MLPILGGTFPEKMSSLGIVANLWGPIFSIYCMILAKIQGEADWLGSSHDFKEAWDWSVSRGV